MQKKPISWGIIALWLLLFFPVGIFFIVKKMSSEKFSYIKNGKSLKVLGYILIGLAIIYLVSSFSNNLKIENGSSSLGGIIVLEIILGGGGALCIFEGMKFVKRGTKINRYISIINAGNDLLVDNIAKAVPTTYEKAIIDIQAILDAGYYLNSYLDLNNRKLVMPKTTNSPKVVINNVYTTSAKTMPPQDYSVKCKNCGATNTVVVGAKNECEYCGSPL